MRRSKLFAVVAILAVGFAVRVGVLIERPANPSRVTTQNYLRLHEGMPAAEAVAILGPPGDYRTAPVEYDVLQSVRGQFVYDATPALEWDGDELCIFLWFPEDNGQFGNLHTKSYAAVDSDVSWADRITWFLQRQWQHWSAGPGQDIR